MSKEKVEKYKEYKANRKEILAKQKKKAKLEKFIFTSGIVLVVAAIGAGLGLTVYNSYKANQALAPNYDREQLVIDDIASIRTTEAVMPEEAVTEEVATEEATTEAATEEAVATEAVETETVVTEAAVTEAVATEAVETEAPVATEEAVTEVPVTEAVETEAVATEAPVAE